MASMVFIVVILCVFLTQLTNRYFKKIYLEDTYEKSNLSINVSEQALTYTYLLILDNVNEFVSSVSFQKTINNLLKNNVTISDKSELQEELLNLNHSTQYIDSAVILTKNKDIIFHFSQPLREGFSVDNYFNIEEEGVNGITFLPIKKSPFTKGNDVIPMVFPIKQLPKDGFFYLVNNYDDAEIFIVLLLNVYDLDKILKISAYEAKDSKLVLVNDKNIINVSPNNQYYNLIQGIVFNNYTNFENGVDTAMVYEGEEFMLFSRAIKYSHLRLINIVSKEHITKRLDEMQKYIFLLGLSGVIFATILSLMLSRFLTKPFGKLMEVIKKISEGKYDVPNETLYNDEIGKLNDSLNSMYSTIKKQFSDIKDKESAKFQVELNLLSEQVNPHFLYNTLECINMEILCKKNESASEMINNLSSFLRIGLNYGNNVILFNDEVKHAQSYLNIMNYRYNHKINFTTYIDDRLKDCKVIKYILQPLIENAIIHGFGENMHMFSGTIPEIAVNAYVDNNMLVIEVNDNGVGIDIEKAEAIIYPVIEDESQGKNHFGLYNVYKRLTHFYGDEACIKFESIPMFKNSVIIIIPFDQTI